MSIEQIEEELAQAQSDVAQDPQDQKKCSHLYIVQYRHSMYVRQDNQPANAEYLGYLNARELYPQYTPTSFREYFVELLAGKAKPVYSNS